jgi:hypothetical protein
VSSPIRILVSGMIAADPHQGGATWAVLQYVLGLRGLGHDVYFVEPVPATSLRPNGASLAATMNAAYFLDVVARFGLADRAALLEQETRQTVGLSYAALVEAMRPCELLINVSGMLTDRRLLETIARRVYLDLDPAFVQLWDAVERIDMRLEGHTHFVTVGQAIGAAGCDIPTCGRTWIPTLQPVCLSEWPARPGKPAGEWTTVGNWRGYGSIHHGGKFYGQKAHSLRRLIDLPTRTRERLRLALSIDPGETNDLEALRNHGWHLVDPAAAAGTPGRYRDFIQDSKGELGIAKSGYVESRCGWFSDRSVCYLASGRPVVAQDTGFNRFIPTGEGLFAFDTSDAALGAIDAINSDYRRHCQRARDLAVAYFAAELVLERLLERIGAGHEVVGPAGSQPRAHVGAQVSS